MHPVLDSYPSPLPRRTEGSAAALSLGAHAAIAILLLWRGALLIESSKGTEAWGRPAMSWVALPEINSQEAETPATPIPAVTVPTVAPPSLELLQLNVPPPIVAMAQPISLSGPLRGSLPAPLPSPVVIDDAVSGGSGKGPSCGGSGEVVASTGADAEPTSSGPTPEPPDDMREHFVQFWVRADGRVTRIAVSPPIRDSHYRRRFMEALGTFVFGGVKTPDGRPIDYVYSCLVYP